MATENEFPARIVVDLADEIVELCANQGLPPYFIMPAMWLALENFMEKCAVPIAERRKFIRHGVNSYFISLELEHGSE